jgi:hypothetical protein
MPFIVVLRPKHHIHRGQIHRAKPHSARSPSGASIIVELFGAIMDADACALADVLVIRALVGSVPPGRLALPS